MRPRLGTVVSRQVHVIALAVVLAATLPVAGGFAQNTELRALLDRLERAERDIRTLYQQGAGGRGAALPRGGTAGAMAADPSGGPALARLNVRLSGLEDQIRALTGRAEGLDHRLDQIDRRLEKLVGDVDYRLGVLERAAAQAPAATPPPATAAVLPPTVDKPVPGSRESGFARSPQTLGTISQSDLAEFAARRSATAPPGTQPSPEAPQARDQTAALPEGTARERYQHATKLLFAQKYDQAEVVLRAFLEAHPDDPLALNARYWLGETYYVRQDFVRAAEVFLKGYQVAPNGPKAPDTLLKLGMSLASLDKRSEACAAFDKLKQDFPELPDNIGKVVARQRLRNDCA